MIPVKIISNKRLKKIWDSEVFSIDPFSYTVVFQTGNRTLTKLYRYEKSSQPYMINEDIETLFAVSRQSERFKGRFILPQKILQVDSYIVGYEMPLIDGRRLSDVMGNCDRKMAIKWFTQIFEDILFLNSLDEAMAFGDLHEDNVLIDKNGKLYYCDIDGFRVQNRGAKSSRYLAMMPHLCSGMSEKYKAEESQGLYFTDKNSDIACLMVMIMNYIMSGGYSFAGISIDDAREYVEFIEQKGMPVEIVEMVRALYQKEDNFISTKALQKMPADLSAFSYESFKKSKSRFKSDEDAISFIENGFMRFKKTI